MILVKNKKAFFDYEISDQLICWIELFWWEVKSARAKAISMKNAYISIINWELFVKSLHISTYKYAKADAVHPERDRKLLAKKAEIQKIKIKSDEPWMTIVPTEILLKNNRIKVKIWLWKWKKKFDKREDLKKKDLNRNLQRKIKIY